MPIDPNDPLVRDILKRVQALEEERDILRTLYVYAHAHDQARDDEWVGLFTDDGVFDARRPGTGRRNAGRDALQRYRADIAQGRRPNARMKHLMTAPLIEVDGEEATVEAYFCVVNNEGEAAGPQLFSFGRYFDRLAKEDGRWRFKERIVDGESYTSNAASSPGRRS